MFLKLTLTFTMNALIILLVFKNCRAFRGQPKACTVTYKKETSLEITSWKFSVSFKSPLTNFVKS